MLGKDRAKFKPFDLNAIEALVLDIDGVLYEGSRVLPGAVELVACLNSSSTPYALLSNNTTRPFQEHAERLSSMGMAVSPDSILTAARITAQLLVKEAGPGTRCLVIGEAGLTEAIQQAGLELAQPDESDAAYVVVGMDRQLTYQKLKTATRAIWDGAQLISSNPDLVYPDVDGLIPASGVVQAALEAATGVQARVIGKPALPGFQAALHCLGCEPGRTGMLGDQLEVDILGAAQAGMHTFLILSSITPAFPAAEAQVQPDRVFQSTLHFYQEWSSR